MAEIYGGCSDLTHFDYNQFFHPNVCHVCKLTAQDRLILCDRCNMISYCSEEHRRLHRPHHEELCILMTHMMNQDPGWYTRSLVSHQWIRIQKNLIKLAQTTLGRELMLYEKQMFMFAKSCFACYRRGNLQTCPQCISFNYCREHEQYFHVHSTIICEIMTLILKLDITALERRTWQIMHVKFTTFPNKKKFFINLNAFCERYFRTRREDSYWCVYDHTFADYVSGPLTLHHGLRSAKLFRPEEATDTFTIHIIAANHVDKRYFPAWELFLHILNKEIELVIVMIGPELQTEIIERDVCSRCQITKKKLILRTYSMFYHDYVQSPTYKRPNVIIGFQADLNYSTLWTASITAMQFQKCPVLLTATSVFNIQKDINHIQAVLDASVKPIIITRNKFFSFRPYRDFELGYVFRNKCLIVYKNLNTLNVAIQASSSSHV